MREQASPLETTPASSEYPESAQLLSDFQQHLIARGHTPQTQTSYVSAVSHFLYWLVVQPLERQSIDAQRVRQFLGEHLPCCRCHHRVNRDVKTRRAALNQLLVMCGEERLRPVIGRATPAIEQWIERFDAYLERVCGLAKATRWYHRRYARAFLSEVFRDAPVDGRRLTAESLWQFVQDHASGYQPDSVAVLTYSLRTLLRFLQLQGEVDPALTCAVPNPPTWSLATLPPSLSPAELACFWCAFDRTTSMGRRDYAMARCLADLGLRCHEVARLQLEDIDWRNGTVLLTASKSRRAFHLPLLQTTGAALVDYLRHARPATSSRSVFVLHRAPRGQAVSSTTVRGAIRRAFERTGLPWTGTHILRHTAATRMVQSGVTLKAMADVLGHRSIDTTLLYTKVDLPQLSRVALPWPGRRS